MLLEFESTKEFGCSHSFFACELKRFNAYRALGASKSKSVFGGNYFARIAYLLVAWQFGFVYFE